MGGVASKSQKTGSDKKTKSKKGFEKKSNIPGPDEKPEIKKIKKQATEKRIYNINIVRDF